MLRRGTASGAHLDQFLNALVLVQFPISALCTWLWQRRRGLNYTEHLYANAFLMAQSYSFQILASPIAYLAGGGFLGRILAVAVPLLVVGYFIFGLYDWFYGAFRWRKAVPAAILGLAIYVVSFVLAMSAVVAWYSLFRATA